METNILTALVAGASATFGALVASVVGPIVKHRLEQSSNQKTRKRAQIQKWRDMVKSIDVATDGDLDVSRELQAHPDFWSLERHLTEKAKKAVYARDITIIDGSRLAAPLRWLNEEIARLEKEWGLH